MYTIKEASARSGVGIPLLRAWERRYGVVTPARTASGYRLYDDDAIARLIAMRRLIEEGWAAQQAAAHIAEASPAELTRLGRPSQAAGEPAPEPPAGVAASAELVERIVDAARGLDGERLEVTLDETFATMRFETAWETVLRPALTAIGRAWQRGDVSVAGEHATSHAILRRMAAVYDAAGASTAAAPILVGLAPGARHEFGALAFATAARRAGLPILYLGPDLPVESWVSAVEDRSPAAAVIGVPRRADVAHGREVVRAIRITQPSTRIVVGGQHADQVDGAHVVVLGADSIAEDVAALRRSLG
ncbi:MAG TPA: MerR family transcriptional regulator [Candidatus Limnocylindria bacterium]|nr:MerR family transcriptional regulator [Candidatus Limnocylindria bacterium]